MLAILNYLSALSGWLPLAAAALRYRRYGSALRLLTWFFVVGALFDFMSVVTDRLRVNNMALFHLFAVVNLLFLGRLYYRALHGPRLRRGLVVALAGLLAFSAYEALRPGGLERFPSGVMTAQCGLFIGLSLTYFYQLLHQPVATAIEQNPLFWVSAGVLVYFSGNLFLFMLQEWLSRNPEAQPVNYWAIHSVANILANLLYAAGLLCTPPRPT